MYMVSIKSVREISAEKYNALIYSDESYTAP